MLPSLLDVRGISSLRILTTILYPTAEIYSTPSQISKVDLLKRMVNCFKIIILIIILKLFFSNCFC